MLPDLLPRGGSCSRCPPGSARWLEPYVLALHEHRGALALVPAAVLVLGASRCRGCAGTTTCRRCRSSNPVLQAEDERVRERVSDFDAGRFVLALGADADAAPPRQRRRCTRGSTRWSARASSTA